MICFLDWCLENHAENFKVLSHFQVNLSWCNKGLFPISLVYAFLWVCPIHSFLFCLIALPPLFFYYINGLSVYWFFLKKKPAYIFAFYFFALIILNSFCLPVCVCASECCSFLKTYRSGYLINYVNCISRHFILVFNIIFTLSADSALFHRL